MKAMLLAAGFGTRLKPLTNKFPKPLIPVAGLPLILYNLALLKKYGFTEIVINLHYQAKLIEDFLGTGKDFGVKIQYSFEETILGTGGGIKKAQPLLNKELFLVFNSDIIVDINLNKLIQFHQKHSPLATLVVQKKRQLTQDSPIYVGSNNVILSILQNPLPQQAHSQVTTFIGIHVISPKIFDLLQENRKQCIVKNCYIPFIKQGGTLMAFNYKGIGYELGTLRRLEFANKQITNKKVLLSYNSILKKYKEIIDKKQRFY